MQPDYMKRQGSGNDHPRIYLINVGANSSHQSRARSPLFLDGGVRPRNFCYVPFYHTANPALATKDYTDDCIPFLNPLHRSAIKPFAHVDPDWENLTYGDCCNEPRARALQRAASDDILLFWGLLYHNLGEDWDAFTSEHGWYLFGSLRIQHVLSADTDVSLLEDRDRERAFKNIHFWGQKKLPTNDRVFVGHRDYSCLFSKAVDLGAHDDSGLLYKVFTAANGSRLGRNGRPKWFSSLRSCRVVLELGKPEHRQRAEMLRDAIMMQANFDLFKDIQSW